ncbi:hypothetical protein COL27_28260, partial [Bacillus sp. AFS075960]
SAGRKLERVSNGAPRGMAATQRALRRAVCTESGLSACFAARMQRAGAPDGTPALFSCACAA